MQDKARGGGGVGRMSSDDVAHPESKLMTLMTPDHAAFRVCSSRYGRAGIGRSSGEVLITGRHL